MKNRYLFSKNNVLRLRYLFVMFCVLSVFVLSLISNESAIGGDNQKEISKQEDNEQKNTTSASLPLASKILNLNDKLKERTTAPEDLSERNPEESNIESFTKYVRIKKGDALSVVFENAGLGKSDTLAIIKAMKEHLDPTKIRPGQQIEFKGIRTSSGEQATEKIINEVVFIINKIKSLIIERNNESEFSAFMHEKEVKPELYAGRAVVQNSLFGSAEQAGIPTSIIAETIKIYSWDVDFQRDIRKGDIVEVLYEKLVTENDEIVGNGNVIYAKLNTGSRELPVYRYTMKNGDTDYFDEEGRSVRKALMKTPIDGARLSSGYGMRKHPVLGYSKIHKGQDWAAPTGTPIYAAGDGVIERASRWSSYGNYVRIRHNSSLKTAYAHLNSYAKGISPGVRVKQGQIIGYVGSTGRSTGPHLHYEIIQDGKQVNPSTIKMPKGKILAGADLKSFKRYVEQINSKFSSAIENKIELVQKSY